MNVHVDANEFREVIDAAVSEAIHRLDAQRPKDATGKVLVDKRGAAELMTASEATIDRWRANHGLPCLKLDDGKVWFRPESLREWAKSREGGAQ